jgi:hypothetical protein
MDPTDFGPFVVDTTSASARKMYAASVLSHEIRADKPSTVDTASSTGDALPSALFIKEIAETPISEAWPVK